MELAAVGGIVETVLIREALRLERLGTHFTLALLGNQIVLSWRPDRRVIVVFTGSTAKHLYN